MKNYIIILLLFTVTTAHAQWSGDWPSYENMRAGKQQNEDLYAALLERAIASSATQVWDDFEGEYVTVPTPTSFWRSRRTMLVAWKDEIENAWMPLFADSNRVDELLTTNDIDHSVVYTVPILLAECSLPTNYLHYTPRKGLSGGGPYTNDSSVGHSYGFTNEFTVNGGTNFPSGRDVWYTTDYGRQGMKDIIDKLDWIPRKGDFVMWESNRLAAFTTSIGDDNNATYAYNKVNEQWSSNAWLPTSVFPTIYKYSTKATVYAAGIRWTAVSQRKACLPGIVGVETNVSSSVDVYFFTDDIYASPGVQAQVKFEDIDGLGFGSNEWQVYESLSEADTTNRSVAILGLIDTSPLADSTLLTVGDEDEYYNASVAEMYWILKYDGANGFKYND